MYQHIVTYYMLKAAEANASGAWKLADLYEYDAVCLMCLQNYPL